MINIPKGTKDCTPNESYKWQYIENAARKVARLYNVKEIRTPVFEHTEVFLRGVGEGTDIVNKEMYTFLDKGGRSITLKPEGTAGIVRAFIENGMANNVMPVKTFYITPCFRYERPQAGRLREFHQFGIEIFGALGADTDAEVILLAKSFLDEIKIKDVKLYINSIGCKECRGEYEKALKAYLKDNFDSLCALCQDRYEKNPLRILDCKNEECKKITAKAPKITDYLCDDCKAHFEKVQSLLKSAGVEFEINPNIVRGLDYYTRTVFEFVSTAIGAQGTVCGGGRYDGLVKELGGNDVCGVGFAAGIERLLLLMENSNVQIEDFNKVDIYIATMGEEAKNKAFLLAQSLRGSGISAEIDHLDRGVKAQFKYADKIGAAFVVTIGSFELESGIVKVKKMADGSETEVKIDNLTEYIVKQYA